MKALAPGLQDHLATGTTTLCWCWRLTRSDGVRLGFTDHDRDVVFDTTTFEACAGFTATQMKDQVGLSVDNLEVESALSSGRLSECDLAAGLYDSAGVELFRVNWASPDQRVLMRQGSLGQVSRTGLSFVAEVRGMSSILQQSAGRLYQYGCDAALGDRRCGVDLASPAYSGTGTITSVVSPRVFTASGLATFASRWFTRGVVTFANSGTAIEVKQHQQNGASAFIELWQEPNQPLSVGDPIGITAGCDKQFATCRDVFANSVNFRGFPHMPGNDKISVVAQSGSTVAGR